MMSIVSRITADTTDNPVAEAEVKHLRRSGGKWFWRLAYAVTAYILLAPLLWGFSSDFSWALSNTLGLLTGLNVAVYLLVGLKTIASAVSAITRERIGNTWELLLLTGFDSRRMVLGKWLGVIRCAWPDFLWVYLLRAGLLLWWSVSLGLHHLTYNQMLNSRLADAQPDIGRLLIAGGIALVYVVLDMALMAALGIATALISKSDRASAWIAIVARIILAAGILYLVHVTTHLGPDTTYPFPISFFYDSGTPPPMLDVAALSMTDGGVLSGLYYAFPYPIEGWTIARGTILTGQVFGMLPFVVFTLISLRLGQFFAYRRGANKPGIRQKVKPKRLPESKPKRQPGAIIDETTEPETQIRRTDYVN